MPHFSNAIASVVGTVLGDYYFHHATLETPFSIQPLWKAVQPHLGLDPRAIEDGDLKQILSGLSSITHGLGAFRTHVGSAHGRGRAAYRVSQRHARLVVNASHTLAMFIIETWDARRQAKAG